MNEIILILGSAAIGFSFAEVSMIPQAFALWLRDRFNIGKSFDGYKYIKTPYRLKPFDCGYCLSFWVAFLSAMYFQYNILFSLMIGFGASIVAITLKKYL